MGITSPTVQNPESNLLDDMRREAESNALRIVQAKLEKPENLEKLDQLKSARSTAKGLFVFLFEISVHFLSAENFGRTIANGCASAIRKH